MQIGYIEITSLPADGRNWLVKRLPNNGSLIVDTVDHANIFDEEFLAGLPKKNEYKFHPIPDGTAVNAAGVPGSPGLIGVLFGAIVGIVMTLAAQAVGSWLAHNINNLLIF